MTILFGKSQTNGDAKNRAPKIYISSARGIVLRCILKSWRRPTLPRVCSTIGADGLNFSVRNGKRWNPDAITAIITLTYLYSCFPDVPDCPHFPGFILAYQQANHFQHAPLFTRASFGLLVRLGFDVTVFTPASYLRHRL